MILRCLLLKEKAKEKLSTMEHHNEIRKSNVDLWKRNEINSVKLLKFYGLDFEPDLIHTVCGYVDVNCFEIKGNRVE